MKRLTLLLFLLLFFLSACGAPAATELPSLPFVITLSPEVQLFTQPLNTPEPLATEQAALPPVLATATFPPTPEPATLEPATATSVPTFTPSLPTPTETLLPPLELPTERRNAPALVPWTGLPTYPADSDPGLLFRVDYDPDIWAQTDGNFGDIVLANRNIPYCTISPWEGRGLPPDWKVEHEFRYIGSASFDVSTVTFQDEVKFVSYVGGDRHVLTGFKVSFLDQKDECLQEAEAVFGTLRSLAAEPTPTPFFTLVAPTP